MSSKGIFNVAHALSYYSRMQEITANNLANASTDGFKVDRITGRNLPGQAFPVPVQHLDLRQGTFRETGRQLDLALEGDGFLVVRTPAGERLTRGGSLRLDPAGQLTDADGNPVLGKQGPIILNTGTVEIQGDGTILVDGAPLDQLRLETVETPESLAKEGAGRFVAPEGTAFIPATNVQVRQGSVEEPNNDTILGMIDLVTIQRAYAANVDALKAMDSVLATVAGDVGKA